MYKNAQISKVTTFTTCHYSPSDLKLAGHPTSTYKPTTAFKHCNSLLHAIQSHITQNQVLQGIKTVVKKPRESTPNGALQGPKNQALKSTKVTLYLHTQLSTHPYTLAHTFLFALLVLSPLYFSPPSAFYSNFISQYPKNYCCFRYCCCCTGS